MLLNGAETARVEETVERIGRACGVRSAYSFVTPTGIFISVASEEEVETRFASIGQALNVDLSKVSRINELSRRFERRQINVDELEIALLEIQRAKPEYPHWIRQTCAGLSGGGFTILFGGVWWDFIPGAICAALANYLMDVLDIRMPRFLAVLFAAFLGTLVASLLVSAGIGTHFYQISLAALIPLVPGLAITNSIRDLMANDLLSGVARFAEAFLTVFAIAVAVAVVFSLRLGGAL